MFEEPRGREGLGSARGLSVLLYRILLVVIAGDATISPIEFSYYCPSCVFRHVKYYILHQVEQFNRFGMCLQVNTRVAVLVIIWLDI